MPAAARVARARAPGAEGGEARPVDGHDRAADRRPRGHRREVRQAGRLHIIRVREPIRVVVLTVGRNVEVGDDRRVARGRDAHDARERELDGRDEAHPRLDGQLGRRAVGRKAWRERVVTLKIIQH